MLIILFWFLSGEEQSGLAISRAKRSRNAYLAYDSGDCSNDNLTTQMEIPVSKFEESSFHAEGGEDHMSGSTEDTETDCSETDSAESDSDEEMAALSGKNLALLVPAFISLNQFCCALIVCEFTKRSFGESFLVGNSFLPIDLPV